MLIAIIGLLFITFAGLGFVFVGGDNSQAKVSKRAQSIGASTGVDKAKPKAAEQAQNRRKQILQTLKAQEKQARKAKLTMESRLRQAGMAPNVPRFWIVCGVLAAVVAVGLLIVRVNPLIVLGAAFVAGLGLPRWVLGFLAKKRVKKFTEDFPNAIDIVVRGIKSGLPVHDCLKIIGRESPEPLAGEFRRLVESLSVGQTVDEGLARMLESMPTSEVRFFSIVLSIQSRTGGNLAEALNNLSVVLRARKLMREKIKAMSGEAVASASIIGSLPLVVMALVSFVSPAYLLPLFTDDRGKVMLVVGVLTMSAGVFVMRRMINFKF